MRIWFINIFKSKYIQFIPKYQANEVIKSGEKLKLTFIKTSCLGTSGFFIPLDFAQHIVNFLVYLKLIP